MQKYNKKNESKEKYAVNREVRIKKLLSIADLNTEEDFKLYIDAVKMNYGGYSIIQPGILMKYLFTHTILNGLWLGMETLISNYV